MTYGTSANTYLKPNFMLGTGNYSCNCVIIQTIIPLSDYNTFSAKFTFTLNNTNYFNYKYQYTAYRLEYMQMKFKVQKILCDPLAHR